MMSLKNGVLGRWAARIGVASLVVSGLGLGGCSSVGKDEYDLVMNENTELRGKNSQLTNALQEANTRNASLEQENRDLASNMGRGATGGTGDTGFGGIAGVGSRIGAGGEVIVDIAGDVLFDSGSVTIKSSARQSLERVAGVLSSRYSGNLIRVEGYTDTDPIKKSKWETNERLSAERALAVEKFLVGKGVSNERIYSAAFGPARAKSSKKDSRRVEIVILASAS